jgi:hypothetical protein
MVALNAGGIELVKVVRSQIGVGDQSILGANRLLVCELAIHAAE